MTLLTAGDSDSPHTISNSAPVAQIIPGRLFFTSFVDSPPKNDSKTFYVDVDEQVHYGFLKIPFLHFDHLI